jgi:hypothetical protein
MFEKNQKTKHSKQMNQHLKSLAPSHPKPEIAVLDHLARLPHSPIGFPNVRTPRRVRTFKQALWFVIWHPPVSCGHRFPVALNRTKSH